MELTGVRKRGMQLGEPLRPADGPIRRTWEDGLLAAKFQAEAGKIVREAGRGQPRGTNHSA